MGLHRCYRIFQHLQYHPPPSLRFSQVMEHRRPITIVVLNCPLKVGEGLQRKYRLGIDMERKPNCLKEAM